MLVNVFETATLPTLSAYINATFFLRDKVYSLVQREHKTNYDKFTLCQLAWNPNMSLKALLISKRDIKVIILPNTSPPSMYRCNNSGEYTTMPSTSQDVHF